MEPSFDDNDLYKGISEGDPSAFRALIALYFPVLCAFAEKYTPDAALAKDIVQEVFIKLWSRRPVFESLGGLKGYLFVAVRNGCLNLIRDRERLESRHQKAAPEPEDNDRLLQNIVESEFIALIYKTVRELPEKMRVIFYLSYEEGMTVGEIALRLKMNLKAVKRQKYRAVQTLRKKLGRRPGTLLFILTVMQSIDFHH
ncbi:RNA polymerase sigma factor [Dinghuibacter silviterrae]|uniref:RNA polymerase sigma-70 factor (ECF subfamily) n=1 Tax=Dinghuibacter silviterrae TaxID=1539049 RepID=A0A4R8DG36_9BACT|nr:RNA polymerase sigma-70 factor [Dinghuibacter silviterrae]TDW96579.1 RNA polymerase sigma-70 factor (ECF subfamily) [Dinghuibacter silviterrae]